MPHPWTTGPQDRDHLKVEQEEELQALKKSNKRTGVKPDRPNKKHRRGPTIQLHKIVPSDGERVGARISLPLCDGVSPTLSQGYQQP